MCHHPIIIIIMNHEMVQGVRLEDEGFFVCSAFSVAGSLATKAYLEVTAVGNEPPPIIRVGHKPCFVIIDMAASK